MAAKSSKNEMFIFGLCSTSDDQPNDPSDENCPKCRKWLPNCQKMKCNLCTPPPTHGQDGDGTGMVWEQAGDGTGMGWVWDKYRTG